MFGYLYAYHSSLHLLLTLSQHVQICNKLVKEMQDVMPDPEEISEQCLLDKVRKRFTREQRQMGKHVDDGLEFRKGCRVSYAPSFFFFFFFFLGYRGIVHPPSDDEGTERTWFEPEQRPRKLVPKRSVHGRQSPQGASKTFWRQDDQP